MDIDKLRYFLTLVQCGSFTEAAKVLRISQPALSKSVNALQDELNCKLYEVKGRTTHITAHGREIAKKAQHIVGLFKELSVTSVEFWAEKESVFRLATFEVFSTHFLKAITEKLGTKVAYEIHDLLPGRMESAIAENRADVGITYLPVAHKEVEHLEVGKVKMGVYGIAARFSDFSFSDFPFVVPLLPPEGVPTKAQGIDGWPEARFPRSIHFRVSAMESALTLCREGLAVAYLPGTVVQLMNQSLRAQNQLTELPCPIPLKERQQPVVLLKRKNDAENKFHRLVSQILRKM